MRVVEERKMTILTLSSKGQLVLPIKIRKRFGLKAGSQVQLIESEKGLLLKLNHAAMPIQDVAACAGLIKIKSSGNTRNLDDFDVAEMVKDI